MEAFYDDFGLDPDILKRQREAKEKVKRIIIFHSVFDKVFKSIFECHKLSEGSVQPECLCILGESGTGKTTVLEHYRDKFPRLETKTGDVIPVLLVELPSGAKPRDVASKILFEMGDPFFDKGTEKAMRGRVINYIEKCHVELLILDEFQHIIDSDTKRVIQKVADWIKGLVNTLKIPIILCGVPDSEKIFKLNVQLDSRFLNRQRLLPFSNGKGFRAFLKAVEGDLPFQTAMRLYDPHVADKLFYASRGNLRVLMRLFENVAYEAIRASKKLIDEKTFFVAFNAITLSDRPYAKNPFNDPSFNYKVAIAEEIEKDKKQKDKKN